jgi:predicted HAD superfamily Cof-like phosphohydrolase
VTEFDPIKDIKDFHEKFGLAYDGPPRRLPRELEQFRRDFLIEEAEEYTVSATQVDRLDALVDIVYVALGSAYMHGFDFAEAWRRVHAANMKKVRAAHAGESARNTAHDVVKPPGWEKPNLLDLV